MQDCPWRCVEKNKKIEKYNIDRQKENIGKIKEIRRKKYYVNNKEIRSEELNVNNFVILTIKIIITILIIIIIFPKGLNILIVNAQMHIYETNLKNAQLKRNQKRNQINNY